MTANKHYIVSVLQCQAGKLYMHDGDKGENDLYLLLIQCINRQDKTNLFF